MFYKILNTSLALVFTFWINSYLAKSSSSSLGQSTSLIDLHVLFCKTNIFKMRRDRATNLVPVFHHFPICKEMFEWQKIEGEVYVSCCWKFTTQANPNKIQTKNFKCRHVSIWSADHPGKISAILDTYVLPSIFIRQFSLRFWLADSWEGIFWKDQKKKKKEMLDVMPKYGI